MTSWRRLRADEQGFTLIELLAAMAIGVVLLLAAAGLMDMATTSEARTRARIDAVARGRAALEQITRQLRSQVCVSTTLPSLDSATNDKVRFFGTLTPSGTAAAGATPEPVIQMRELEFVEAGSRGSIVERVYPVTGTPPDVTPASTASSVRTLVQGIARVPGTPVFRFYKYDAATSPGVVLLTTPVDVTGRQLTVRVDVSFDSFPEGSDDARLNTVFSGRTFVRTADPTDPEHSPKCI